jgi:alpha-tubulin suppressor-like RCC1 family protein
VVKIESSKRKILRRLALALSLFLYVNIACLSYVSADKSAFTRSSISAPTNVCGESNGRVVRLRWDHQQDPEVAEHFVQGRVVGEKLWTLTKKVASSDFTTFKNLKRARYEFRVAALERDGNRSAWGSYCLLGWGRNGGMLGNGYREDVTRPVPVGLGIIGQLRLGQDSLTAGHSHTCVINIADHLACWGWGDAGQLGDGRSLSSNVPVNVVTGTNFGDFEVVQLTAGDAHTCALLKDGGISCWGSNLDGQLGDGTNLDKSSPINRVGGVLAGNIVTKISAGSSHSCALTISHKVSCWGLNQFGQLGEGSTNSSNSPSQFVGGLLDGVEVSDISAGAYETCAVTSGGEVVCWGRGHEELSMSLVGGVLTGIEVKKVQVGYGFRCALTADGRIACWGSNSLGQLGNGQTRSNSQPTSFVGGVLGGIQIKDFTVGRTHTCAISVDGALACWGGNLAGQIGIGSSTRSETRPVAIHGHNSGVAAVALGAVHTCAEFDDGAISCWGSNSAGQLGIDSDEGSYWSPVFLSSSTWVGKSISRFSLGEDHACGVDGAVVASCWGYNGYGQAGPIRGDLYPLVPFPFDFGLFTTNEISEIASRGGQTCVLTTSGSVACWGRNLFGMLGDGTTIGQRTTPFAFVAGVLADRRVTQISVGGYNACAVVDDGRVACWGWRQGGLLGDGKTKGSVGVPRQFVQYDGVDLQVKQISIGVSHTCAVRLDNQVVCWGRNDFGALGTGDRKNRATPQLVVSTALKFPTFRSISAGAGSTCGVTLTSDIACWGDNRYGQIGDGSEKLALRPVVVLENEGSEHRFQEVSTSSGTSGFDGHTCAREVDGDTWCWGANRSGQLGLGDKVMRLSPVRLPIGTSKIVANGETTMGLWNGELAIGPRS